jgi:hypothetical protein
MTPLKRCLRRGTKKEGKEKRSTYRYIPRKRTVLQNSF